MPSALDKEREWARAEFGSIDPGAIISYLESCGYRQITEKKNYGCWYGPDRPETEKETRCLDFLCAEWDFGGVVGVIPKEIE